MRPRLYYEASAYYAALHLAGAAEELLSCYLREEGQPTAFESLVDGVVTLSSFVRADGSSVSARWVKERANEPRNATKHERPYLKVHFDPKSEARDMLDRAVSNYYRVMAFYSLPESELIQRFSGHEMIVSEWRGE